jgi:hypothetical protein
VHDAGLVGAAAEDDAGDAVAAAAAGLLCA